MVIFDFVTVKRLGSKKVKKSEIKKFPIVLSNVFLGRFSKYFIYHLLAPKLNVDISDFDQVALNCGKYVPVSNSVNNKPNNVTEEFPFGR
jgi:hypothetical protein